MKVTQFYPNSLKIELTTSSFNFEPGGIFVNYRGTLYFNHSDVEFIFHKDYSLANTFERIIFKPIVGEPIYLTHKQLNSSNLKSQAVRFAKLVTRKPSEASNERLINEINEFCHSSLIETALRLGNKKMFYKLTSKT